ncbi:SDR family oxidoreductase [Streptomyces sp. NPDC005708]|uniref:SDR family NAD(P)-dependent oxidoreductase n=1 Tax=Streptomyces sp. NPDC005708 TaxID=3154564 RepID=UPI00340B204E
MTRLDGLVAVVTGGNGGIGLAMAEGIGSAGAKIVIWGRNTQKNGQAVEELGRQSIEAYAVECDVAHEASVEAAMARTLELAERVDCVVANAGVARSSPFVETTLKDWEAVMRPNLDGVFLSTRAAARHMVARGEGGSIIIVSSMASRFGAARQAAYAASKSGLIGLGRTLAVELARSRIRCNMVLPGWTETAMTQEARTDERFLDATTRRTPIRRWLKPEEFGDLAAYLADPRQLAHTGDELVVDGGYSVF